MGTVEPRYNEHLYSEQIFLVPWRFVIRRFTVVHFQKSCTSWGEVTNRITETSVTIGRHREKICLGAERHQPQLSSKLKVYRVVELTTLLYAGETRTFYSRHDAQSLLSELPPQTSQNSWQGGNRQGWHPSVCTVLQKAKFRWPAMSPGCLKIAATVWSAAVMASARLKGTEEAFRILPQGRVPQRPWSRKPSTWESRANCKDRSTLASKSYHWGPCGRKTKDRNRRTQKTCLAKLQHHTLLSHGFRLTSQPIFGPTAAGLQSEVMVIFDFRKRNNTPLVPTIFSLCND